MTGQKTWAVGEEVLAPDFNNLVQSQVVAQFANTAARDAWAGPPVGAMCITTDTGTLWQRVGGAWVQRPATTVGPLTSLGGFPAGQYTYPASPQNVSNIIGTTPLLPSGLTAWAGLWLCQLRFTSSPSDAGQLTLSITMDGTGHTQTSVMAFSTASALVMLPIGAGKTIAWQLYKNPGTASWTASTINCTLAYLGAT